MGDIGSGAMAVQRGPGKTWLVLRDGEVIKDNLTNSQAWRFVDLHAHEAINRSQEVSDWIFRQQAGRGA